MMTVRPNLRRSMDEPESQWCVSYGWWLIGTYAHACNGSVVQRTFIGPGSIRRAVRHCERQHRLATRPDPTTTAETNDREADR